MRHLRAQTARARLELVLVAPSEDALADRRPGETDGFARVHTVAAGPIESLERAAAIGVAAASAPLVALLEDHVYPEPGWAEAVLAAHGREWAAVGSVFTNGNPGRPLSWAHFLLAYGRWAEPAATGEIDEVSHHNVSLDRAALEPLRARLPELLARDGRLLPELRERGGRFRLAADARLAHANPSRLVPSARLRFHAGRLYGAERAAASGWSPPRRALYVAASPLIPLVRLWRERETLLSRDRHPDRPRGTGAALALCLACDAAGQAAGYALGEGAARRRLERFEHDRLRHLTRSERALLSE